MPSVFFFVIHRAIASQALGSVHGRVGVCIKHLGRDTARAHTESGAGRNTPTAFIHNQFIVAEPADSRPHAIDDLGREPRACRLKQQAELVAAQSGNEVVFTQRAADRGRHPPQHLGGTGATEVELEQGA